MILEGLFNPFKKLHTLIAKRKFEDAMEYIFLNPKLTKQPNFLHLCAYSKNYNLIKFALKYEPSFYTPEEKYNPLHFLANIRKYDTSFENWDFDLFAGHPNEYIDDKRNKKKQLIFKTFDSKCIKLIDKKKRYMHESSGIFTLSPIDICISNLDVEGVKSFVKNGVNLKTIIKNKRKISRFHQAYYDVGFQYYNIRLIGLVCDISFSHWDKISKIYKLLKKQLPRIDFDKWISFCKATSSSKKEAEKYIKDFKYVIKN